MTSLRRGPPPGKRRPGRRRSERARRSRSEEALDRSDRRAVRQGAAILAALALVAAGIFLLDPIQRWMAAGPELVVTAAGSRGLEVGAPVWVAGTRAGRVTSVQLRPPGEAIGERVIIRAVLEEDAAPHLRAGAEAWIQQSALLAPAVLAVSPGPSDAPPFDYGDTLRAVERVTAGELRAAADTARIRAKAFLGHAREVQRLLDGGHGTLGRLNRDTALRRTLRRDLDAARRVAAALEDHRGLAALRDGGTAVLLDSLSRLAVRIRRGTPDRAAALDALDRSLTALGRRIARLDSLTAAGTGTLGRLRADGELREQVELLRNSVPRTREILFSDPLRWLRIRLF